MTEVLEQLREGLRDRYDIQRLIGEGGMATVYRAVERKHGRPVAIKVLKPVVAAAMGADRFALEIDLAARLQHPNIVPLFDSGATGGIVYYVMPFVEGESLRERLDRDGTIPFDQALDIARDVASALGYAHAQGVVHRDIKPENIMLSGGRAVVADFGVARAVDAARTTGAGLTEVGFVVGTPAYMSPEQATASAVDGRTDQYGLACVLYEMVSGQQPFSGPTGQAVLTQSLTSPRPRLSKLVKDAPPRVDAVVARALAADPAQRYDTVPAFAEALVAGSEGGTAARKRRRRLLALTVFFAVAFTSTFALRLSRGFNAAGPVRKEAASIAVLPFTATGPGTEGLGEGMVDLLTANLNTVGGIRAAEPRMVMARWRKAGGGPGDVESALGMARGMKANSVILGSIVGAGGRVRISATLHGPDGGELAKAQVDGTPDSVLALVDGLSAELVRGIWRSKEPVPSLRVSGITTNSLPAMQAFLNGERYYRLARWDSAEAAFSRAVDIDSTFSLAHYRLGATIGWQGGYAKPRAQAASAAARRFSARLPGRERAIVLAYDLFNQGDVSAADSMRKYVERYPEDADGWFLLGESLTHGQSVEGLDPAALQAPFDRVLALDSTLSPAALHPAEAALTARDSAGLRRYIAALRSAGATDQADAFQAAGQVVANRRLDSASARAAGRWPGALRSALTGMVRDPAITGEELIALLSAATRAAPGGGGEANMVFARAVAYAGVGRFDRIRPVLDSLRPLNPFMASDAELVPVFVGIAPPGYAAHEIEAVRRAPRRDPFLVRRQVVLALSLGDLATAARLTDSILAVDSTRINRFARALLVADRGRILVERGDTTAGIAALRAGIRGAGANGTYFTTTDRITLGMALAANPATRAEGLRMLDWGFMADFAMVAVAELNLGRATESAGDKAAAIRHYSRVLRLWDRPSAGAEGPATEARRALARLTGEGQPLEGPKPR